MAADLNQMVARQSKMAIKNHNTEHRVKTHPCKPGSPRQTLPLSENLLQRHRTSDPSTNIKDFKGRKGSQVERRRGRRRERGAKGVAYRRLLPPTDIQVLWDFSLGLQRREDWNSALPEIRPDQNQNSSYLPRGGDQSPILSSD